MVRQLCQFVVIWSVVYAVATMPHERRQTDNSTSSPACNGPLSQFADRRFRFTDGARVLSLRKGRNGNLKCLVYDDSEGEDTDSQERYKLKRRLGETVDCTDNELSDLIKQCKKLVGRNSSHVVVKRKRSLLVFPGTLWCGAGNNANGDKTKLGKYAETDSCCRAHDLCNPHIAGFGTDKATGLTNDYPFTRLHCRCDLEFKACLKKSSEELSDDVGDFYFNVLSSICFDVVSPCGNEDRGRTTSANCKWDWFSAGGY